MSKIIKTTNADITVNTSTTLVVEIGELCFEVDERFPWINVYKISDFVKKEFITEIDEDDMPIFVEHEELKRYCLNWYFNNVEIIVSEDIERTAQEVSVQEQYVSECSLCGFVNKIKLIPSINPSYCMNCGNKTTYSRSNQEI